MEKSKVYFTDMRALPGTSLPQKLQKLMRRAGIADIDFERKITAIKMHFGEPGNLSYLRPNYAKAVADLVKELGGRPFLTDCNTLYVGRRKDALEHLSAAYENGFGLLSTGCHVIIGDGLKGTDDVYVPVHGGELVKEAKIGKAVMDADVFISLSHFKGHEMAGFGGAIMTGKCSLGATLRSFAIKCPSPPSIGKIRRASDKSNSAPPSSANAGRPKETAQSSRTNSGFRLKNSVMTPSFSSGEKVHVE